jgi:hypothetical protein
VEWSKALEVFSAGWFGSLIGLAGIVLGFVFYYRSLARVVIAFQHDTVHLIGGRGAAFPKEVEVRFDGRPVAHVAMTRVVVWNAGNKPVAREDIVSSDSLRLRVSENCKVVRHEVIRQLRAVNRVELTQRDDSPNELNLTFDFLDPGDGATIEVLHSGETKAVEMLGTIRGARGCLRNHGRALWYSNLKGSELPFPLSNSRAVLGVGIGLGLLMSVAGLFRPEIAVALPSAFGPEDPQSYTKIAWPFVIAGLVYASLPGAMMWLRRRRYPSELEPSGSTLEKVAA